MKENNSSNSAFLTARIVIFLGAFALVLFLTLIGYARHLSQGVPNGLEQDQSLTPEFSQTDSPTIQAQVTAIEAIPRQPDGAGMFDSPISSVSPTSVTINPRSRREAVVLPLDPTQTTATPTPARVVCFARYVFAGAFCSSYEQSTANVHG